MSELLKVPEVAELLGVSVHTVYSMVHRRAIPHYKPTGKLLYFKESEIIDWVQNARVEINNGGKE